MQNLKPQQAKKSSWKNDYIDYGVVWLKAFNKYVAGKANHHRCTEGMYQYDKNPSGIDRNTTL
jgi:hypothetical protein